MADEDRHPARRLAPRSNTGPVTGRRRFCRASAATVATAVGLTALGGQAAAHFEETLDVDVEPWHEDNRIHLDGRGLVPVAVHQTDDFDPTSRDVRYRFGAPDVVGDGGGARPIRDGFAADVDDDGREALVLLFPLSEAGFDSQSTEARLVWERSPEGGHGLAGTDGITIVEDRGWWH